MTLDQNWNFQIRGDRGGEGGGQIKKPSMGGVQTEIFSGAPQSSVYQWSPGLHNWVKMHFTKLNLTCFCVHADFPNAGFVRKIFKSYFHHKTLPSFLLLFCSRHCDADLNIRFVGWVMVLWCGGCVIIHHVVNNFCLYEKKNTIYQNNSLQYIIIILPFSQTS